MSVYLHMSVCAFTCKARVTDSAASCCIRVSVSSICKAGYCRRCQSLVRECLGSSLCNYFSCCIRKSKSPVCCKTCCRKNRAARVCLYFKGGGCGACVCILVMESTAYGCDGKSVICCICGKGNIVSSDKSQAIFYGISNYI